MFSLSSLSRESSRISYVKPSFDYISIFHEYSLQKDLYTHLEFDPFVKVSDSEEYMSKILARIDSGTCDYRLLLDHNHSIVLGLFGFTCYDHNRQSIDFSYGISPKCQGRGFFKEASFHLFQYLRLFTSIHRVYAITSSINIPSISALLSIDFELEGTMRDYYRFPDHYQDAKIFSHLIRRQ